MRLLRGWAPPLRIARRDALRAPGRSALIVAMIALPVLGMSSVDVLVRSAQLDPPERATRELGRTQARLTQLGSEPIYQSPDGGRATSVPTQGPAPAAPTTPDLRTLVPSGFRVLTEQSSSVTARTRSGVANVGWAEVAAGDPAFRGHFVVSAGRAPRRAGEVAVTAELLQRLGARIGGRVRLTTPDRTFSLVGVLRRAGRHGDQLFWAAPGTLIGAGDLAAYDAPTLYLVGSRPVTWTTVTELNTHGVQVVSRAVLLDPPARADVPYFTAGLDSGNAGTLFLTIMMIAVVIILCGLEVVLLAGAAFAVGARRQARALGLLAANGGAPGQVRRVVLGGGLVLGVAGACVGVLLGLVTAAVARAPLGHLTGSDFGHYDVRPLELLAIAFVGVVTGLLAAVLPARTAARQDPVVALSGRRGVVRTPRKVPAIGLTTVVLGIAAAALGSSLALAYATGLNPTNGGRTVLTAGLIGGGAALAQIGLIICSPAIMGLAGRWSTRLPLAGRLALRDAARHRGRSAPAMAAVLTAVTGSTALALYVSAVDASDRASYRPSWPASTAGVQLLQYDYQGVDKPDKRTSVDPARVEAAVQAALPAYTPYVVRTTDERCDGTGSGCSSINLLVPKANLCPTAALGDVSGAAPVSAAARDPRCQERGYETGNLPGTVVDDGALLRALHAPSAARAASALRAGGVVVFDPRYLQDGHVTIAVVSAEESAAALKAQREPRPRQVRVPAVYVPAMDGLSTAVLGRQLAARLGLSVEPSALLLHFDQLPTTDQEDAARKALGDAGITSGFTVERGYVSRYGLGLLALVVGAGIITLGAAGIATGLAQADSRADHATLAAVGATPRLRRTLAAAQALTVGGLGTALGIAAGFVPAVALIGAVPSLRLVIPWLTLAEILVILPLLAALLAWLLTRSRVPLDRRLA